MYNVKLESGQIISSFPKTLIKYINAKRAKLRACVCVCVCVCVCTLLLLSIFLVFEQFLAPCFIELLMFYC